MFEGCHAIGSYWRKRQEQVEGQKFICDPGPGYMETSQLRNQVRSLREDSTLRDHRRLPGVVERLPNVQPWIETLSKF